MTPMNTRLGLLTIFAMLAMTSALSCHDQHNNTETWWYAQKYPRNVSSSNPRYGYFDSSSTSGEFSVISGFVDSTGGAMYNTIAAINALSSKTKSLLVFNDQPPNQEWVSGGAHAKGIVAWEKESKTGVYIMHSAPKFPAVENGWINSTLPSNTFMYGQNFFCINIDQTSLDLIIQNFEVTQPIIYYYSGIFLSNYSSLKQTEINNFELDNGNKIFMLSKSPNFKGFLYENIIETYFKAGMMVESWGRPYQQSECPPSAKYMSANVEQVRMPNGDTWNDYSDHSKWGVVQGDGFNYGCSCDMNRMTSQMSRGGSCLCLVNENFYNTLNNFIEANGCDNAEEDGQEEHGEENPEENSEEEGSNTAEKGETSFGESSTEEGELYEYSEFSSLEWISEENEAEYEEGTEYEEGEEENKEVESESSLFYIQLITSTSNLYMTEDQFL